MKAVYINAQGGPEVLTYGERPEPTIGPGEIMARVRACALNHLDTWIRSGGAGIRPWFERSFPQPHILGLDIAGDVVQIGPEVTSLKEGDRVLFDPNRYCHKCYYCVRGHGHLCENLKVMGVEIDGGYAEYVKAPAENAFPIPEDMSFEEAAAIPSVFFTSWHMLITLANLRAGEDVLIHAAGSGLGSAAIQIAKVCGARVITTASTGEKLERAKAMGADDLINYTTEADFSTIVKEKTEGRGVDVVFDHIGSSIWNQNMASLKKEGRLVNAGVTSGEKVELNLTTMMHGEFNLMGSFKWTTEEAQKVMHLVHNGKLHGVIADVFPLKEAATAHQVMESRNFFGKLVLIP